MCLEADHPIFTSSGLIILFYRERSSALRPTPNLEDQVPVFMSPSDKVAPGSLFVAFYDSQDYDGGIPSRLHAFLYLHGPLI
jgi:hypothetical protein